MTPAAIILAILPFTLGQDPQAGLILPLEVRGKVGEFIMVKATTTGALVRWVLMDEGPAFLPTELLKDTQTAVLFSLKPGKFRVLAYTSINGTPTMPAIATVIVGDSPKPAPPTPPTPPPTPVDPLVMRFQAAYTTSPEPPATKTKQKDLLVGLYQAMAIHAADTNIRTTNDLLGDLKKTAEKLLLPDVLVEVRKLISAEVGAVLGNAGAVAIDEPMRKKAVEIFGKIARSLDSVK